MAPVTIRVARRSTIALAAAGALASTGTAYLGARNLLVGQATQARTVIPKSWDIPPRADGVYTPGGGPVQRWHRGMSVDLHLMIFGDSTATGYGCFSAEEVPGVLIARGLAEQTGKTHPAEHQSDRRRDLEGRVRPGRRDVRGRPAAGRRGDDDRRQRRHRAQRHQPVGAAAGLRRCAGCARAARWCVVGTCPDLGVITAIPQPLRSLAHSRGLQLARAQAAAVKAEGGVPVPLADLLAHQFRAAPELMFSADGFHPSPTAYALAAEQLLPALCEALGEKDGVPTVEPPAHVPA